MIYEETSLVKAIHRRVTSITIRFYSWGFVVDEKIYFLDAALLKIKKGALDVVYIEKKISMRAKL